MHSKSDITEFIIYDNADEVIEQLFQSPLSRYQIGLETSMRGINFIFDCVYLKITNKSRWIIYKLS